MFYSKFSSRTRAIYIPQNSKHWGSQRRRQAAEKDSQQGSWGVDTSF